MLIIMTSVMYLTIPKTKAERLIISSHINLVVIAKSDEKIRIGYEPGTMSNNWMCSLYDYEFTNKKVETDSGVVESGIVGTKMEYRTNRTDTKSVKQAVSDHVES